MFGYDSPEDAISTLTNLPQQIFVDPSDREDLWAELLEKGFVNAYEVRQKRKDGTIFWVSENARIVRDSISDIVYMEGTLQDITAQKNAETASKDADAKYRSIFENAVEGISSVDAAGHFLSINPAFSRMLGYDSVEEFMSTVAGFESHLYADAGCRDALWAILRERGFAKEFEARLRRKDGNVIWTSMNVQAIRNEDSELLHCNAMVVDITARKASEDALHEAELKYRSIFDNSIVGIFQADSKGQVISANAAVLRIFGYDQSDDVTSDPNFTERLYVDPLDREKLWSGLQEHGFVENFELRCKQKSGKLIWVSENVRVVRGDTSEILFCEGTVTEITARKEAEEALAESRKFLQATIDALPSHLSVIDETGTIIAVNAPWRNFGESYGVPGSRGEVGLNYLDVCETTGPKHKEFASKAAAGLRAIIAGETESFDLEYPFDTTSESRWFIMRARRFPGEGPCRVAIAHLDVTGRKRAEREILQLHREQALILDSVDVGIHGIDKDGRISFENSAATRMFGGSTGEMLGSIAHTAMHHAKADGSPYPIEECPIHSTLADGEVHRVDDEVFWRKDGTSFPVEYTSTPIRDESQNIVGAVVSFRDITQSLKSQRALEESEERYRDLFENAHDLIQSVAPDGSLAYVNRAWRETLGYTEAEIPSLSVYDIIHDDSLEEFRSLLNRAMAGDTQPQIDVTLVTKEGRAIVADGSLSCSFRDGTPKAARFILRDITERRQAHEALRESKDELEVRVKMRTAELAKANDALQAARDVAEAANNAKSEFLSRMSHELRTPLNAILGFGQILEMRELDELERESIGHILKGGRHLLDLINEILDIARVESGRVDLSIESIDVDDVIGETVDLIRPLTSQYNVQLIVKPSSLNGKRVLADHQRLKQVLINLIGNAMKYNREGGEVRVSCENQPDGHVRVNVADTGYGLSAEDIAKIFIPFERLRASQTDIVGTGLGLTLSRRLMEAMNGTLGVESVVGQGSTFYVDLPLAPAQQGDSAREALLKPDLQNADNPPVARPTMTVLSIEDNASNYRLIEAILRERPGVKLIGAMQGSIGISLAQTHHPDLILLDMHLPDMTGVDVLRTLKRAEATASIPVVIVSADATDSHVERVLESGATAYLTKPLDVRQILETVDQVSREAGP
jgi:PAS domain S-box-containing protein